MRPFSKINLGGDAGRAQIGGDAQIVGHARRVHGGDQCARRCLRARLQHARFDQRDGHAGSSPIEMPTPGSFSLVK